MIKFFIILYFVCYCSTSFSEDIFIRLNKNLINYDEKTDFIYKSITDGNSLEKEYWFSRADAGMISYEEAKENIKRYAQERDGLNYLLDITNGVDFPCFSLYKRSEGFPIEYFYDMDENQFKIETPSQVIKYLKFQCGIKNLIREGDISSLDNIDNGDFFNVKHSRYHLSNRKVVHNKYFFGTDFSNNEFIQLETIGFQINTFPNTKDIILSRKCTIDNEIFGENYDVEYNDMYEIRLKFFKFLHNNTYLDTSVAINKIKEKIEENRANRLTEDENPL